MSAPCLSCHEVWPDIDEVAFCSLCDSQVCPNCWQHFGEMSEDDIYICEICCAWRAHAVSENPLALGKLKRPRPIPVAPRTYKITKTVIDDYIRTGDVPIHIPPEGFEALMVRQPPSLFIKTNI